MALKDIHRPVYIVLILIVSSPFLMTPLWAQDVPPDASPDGGISGAFTSLLGESFQTDLATGAATLSIPINTPPGRKNMQPKLALSYSSNNSNSICGVGWSIPINCIQRSTKKGVPTYDDTKDIFIFMSSGANAELVNIGNNEYRAKIESAFMKYLFNNTANSWTAYDKSGMKYIFGNTISARTEDSGRTFAWYLERVEDVYGNYISYIYEKPEDGQIYLNQIKYTGYKDDTGLLPDKDVVLVYADRADKVHSYRSGWKIATTKRLSSVQISVGGALAWNYELGYATSPDTGRSLLASITIKDGAGLALPKKTFTYQRLD